MDILILAVLVLLGVGLIFLEVFFFPGTTFVGIIGVILLAGGIYFTYDKYGQTPAIYTGVISIVVSVGIIIIGFRSGAWKAAAVYEIITGRVNDLESLICKVGDKGVSFTDIRPSGKAVINDEKIEVYSLGEFIERNTIVQVVKIEQNKIYITKI